MSSSKCIGKNVKIVFYPTEKDSKLANPERMWVLVQEELSKNRYKGYLNNDPHWLKSVKFKDEVVLHESQIIAVEINSDLLPDSVFNEYSLPYEQRHFHHYAIFGHYSHQKYKDYMKITVDVDDNYAEDFLKEELLVEEVGFRKYRIMCIPLLKSGLGYDDTIEFLPDDYFNYTVEKGEFISIDLQHDSDDFSVLEKYKKFLYIEKCFVDGYISFAFNKTHAKQVASLLEQIDLDPSYSTYVHSAKHLSSLEQDFNRLIPL